MADLKNDELFDEVAACAHDIALIQQHSEAMDNKIRSMDRNLMMTLKGIMVLMEDMMFATMPSDGFTADQKVRLADEQRIARQRIKDTLDALKKAIG